MTLGLIWLCALLYVAGAVVTRDLLEIGVTVADGKIPPAWARVLVVLAWPLVAIMISVTRIAGSEE